MKRIPVPALLICGLRLRGRKLPSDYPREPRTLGEHLKKRRLDLGLTQKDVARQLEAHPASYRNWEKGHSEPEVRFLPGIIRFLDGYDPRVLPPSASLGERIKACRERQGLSQGACQPLRSRSSDDMGVGNRAGQEALPALRPPLRGVRGGRKYLA